MSQERHDATPRCSCGYPDTSCTRWATDCVLYMPRPGTASETERTPQQIGKDIADKIGTRSAARLAEPWQEWRDADPETLEPFYSKWVSLLTSEGLHAKADIATVLALIDRAASAPSATALPHAEEIARWKSWAEYACRRFKEETGKDLQADAPSR